MSPVGLCCSRYMSPVSVLFPVRCHQWSGHFVPGPMTTEMWSTYYQMTVTQLIQESLVKLCVEHVPCSDTLEIDGIVCIARGDDSKQLVVKIHQVLDLSSQKESKHLANDSGGDTGESHVNTKVECSTACHQLSFEDNADLSSHANSTTTNDSEKQSRDDVCSVPLVQSGNDLVSVAPTTPIWKWRRSSSPSFSPVKPKSEQDIDNMNEEDFLSTKLTDRELVCKKCGATFHSVTQLQSHTAKVHSRYMCKHCLNTFSLRCNLRRHERLHAGLKPYSCDICNKSFARSTDLKIHMARHTIGGKSVPSFTCSRCPKTFSGLSSLRWHMYKIHKQLDAIHQCGICREVFFDRMTFQAHRTLHTDTLVTTPEGGGAAKGKDSLEEDMMEDRDSPGEGDNSLSSCQKTDAAMTGVTATSTCPAMVSILKMNVTRGPLHVPKQELLPCANASWHVDKLLELPSNPVLSPPGHMSQTQTLSLYQAHSEPVAQSVFDSSGVPAIGSDTGKHILTQLLMTVADTNRSKRRKGRPVKHIVSSDIASSDVSDSDMSDASGDNQSVSQSMPRTNGAETVETLCRNTSGTWCQAETPQSASMQSDSQPITSDVQSVVTPAGLQRMDPDIHTQTESAISGLDTDSYDLDKSADLSETEQKGYICNRFNCGKVFVGFSKYELHYIEKHDRYPCHFCDNSFTGKNNRIRHEKSHTGGKSYRCKDCARMFSRPDSLREHQFTHTASYREQKCRICGATYDKKAQLLSHMKKCFRGMRIVDYSTDSVEVRLPKRGRKEDDPSLLADSFTT